MSDYISREALWKKLDALDRVDTGDETDAVLRVDALEAVENIPASDVRPVVRGKWELLERRILTGVKVWKCNKCGNRLEVRDTTFNAGRGDCNFCPHCGADMRELNHRGTTKEEQNT